MTGARPSARASLAALAAVLIVLAVFWGRSGSRPPASTASSGTAASPTADPAEPSVAAPVIEVDAQGALLKVSHKDPSGRIPLEYVETPEGTVTIRRTFDASGRVLKEEAFRGDQPVPLPPAR